MVTPQSVQGHTGLTHHFLISDIRALWRSRLSAREPECQKLKNGGLDQYGPGRFRRLVLLQSEKCGTERVNAVMWQWIHKMYVNSAAVKAASFVSTTKTIRLHFDLSSNYTCSICCRLLWICSTVNRALGIWTLLMTSDISKERPLGDPSPLQRFSGA